MGTHTYYTLGQARLLLGEIDWKTLNSWLSAAAIIPERDPRDRRMKRISRKQLHRVASLHGIALSNEDSPTHVQDTPSPRYTHHPDDVEHLQQSIDLLTTTFDQRFEQAAHQLDTSLQEGLQEVKKELLSFIRAVFRELLTSGRAPVEIPPSLGEERLGGAMPLSQETPIPPHP